MGRQTSTTRTTCAAVVLLLVALVACTPVAGGLGSTVAVGSGDPVAEQPTSSPSPSPDAGPRSGEVAAPVERVAAAMVDRLVADAAARVAEEVAREEAKRVAAEAAAREAAEAAGEAAERAAVEEGEAAATEAVAREAEEQAARDAEEQAARDAEEEAAREAEEQAAREAEEQAAREAEEQAAREAEEQAARDAEEEAAREAEKEAAREAEEAAEDERRARQRHDDLVWAQERLTELRYYIAPIDGDESDELASAVVAFQKVNGLTVDGDIGLQTLAALGDPVAPDLRPGPADRIEVDLTDQVLHLVVDGTRVRTLPISSGNGETYTIPDGRPAEALTPVGSFVIERRITGLRVGALGGMYDPLYFYYGWAIHGSNNVPAHPASHGCIRLTRADILWLVDLVPDRFPVEIHGGRHTFVPGSSEQPPIV